MKNNKKFLLLLIGILTCILLFSIVQIYAKYLTSANGKTGITIAKWNISVNNKSIKNNSDISTAIEPIFNGNANIAPGIIAPTAEGYFDLVFDFSDVDVSFNYEINVSADENSSVSDLVATGYSIVDSDEIPSNWEKQTFETFNQPIADNILLGSNISKRTIRIYVLWNDDESTSQMSNDQDTESTKQDEPALLDVNISFTQIAESINSENSTNSTDSEEQGTT